MSAARQGPVTPTVKRSNRTGRHDHEPVDLVFGPVNSRRFGRSFGISLSWPGQRSCRWSCGYCQLGHWPHAAEGDWAAVDQVASALARAHPGDADVICCSGAGENLDHPQFIECLALMQDFARRWQRPLVVLTNGDALLDQDLRRAVVDSGVAVYVKWDCGVRSGAWRQMSGECLRMRQAMLRNLPDLRLQSMFVWRQPDDPRFQEAARRWLDEVCSLPVKEVHMCTVDRPCTGVQPCFPAAYSELSWWRTLLRARLDIPVRIFAQ